MKQNNSKVYVCEDCLAVLFVSDLEYVKKNDIYVCPGCGCVQPGEKVKLAQANRKDPNRRYKINAVVHVKESELEEMLAEFAEYRRQTGHIIQIVTVQEEDLCLA